MKRQPSLQTYLSHHREDLWLSTSDFACIKPFRMPTIVPSLPNLEPTYPKTGSHQQSTVVRPRQESLPVEILFLSQFFLQLGRSLRVFQN
ncbi:hypothetical protein AVEN_177097-1 [Araneus ventricosus]|uniref:Uncharacterized protein n=1 Tax=Araneus ventricosus TaxID=182803 RepID=A0A4Y2VGJ5_ARAVE|nr:hypothetical protein AVEN_177097-1 [Araneus ventricosus]